MMADDGVTFGDNGDSGRFQRVKVAKRLRMMFRLEFSIAGVCPVSRPCGQSVLRERVDL